MGYNKNPTVLQNETLIGLGIHSMAMYLYVRYMKKMGKKKMVSVEEGNNSVSTIKGQPENSSPDPNERWVTEALRTPPPLCIDHNPYKPAFNSV